MHAAFLVAAAGALAGVFVALITRQGTGEAGPTQASDRNLPRQPLRT